MWHVDTEYPVALDSYDHTDPQIKGKEDFSYNLAFNAKLYELFVSPISVLDIGCGGGSFVKTVLDEGYQAVGLEGSTHPRDRELGGWPFIADHLFTCDVTHPFVVHQGDHVPFQFDVVTAWEFLEHIQEKDLSQVWWNILDHLKEGGLFIITTPSDIRHHPKRGLDHHRTRRPQEWWESMIVTAGFQHCPTIEDYFGSDWVRKRGVRNVYKKDIR